MHIAAVIGALIIVGTKCMTVQEAFRAIDWNCLFLMGSLSAVSTGLQNSGVGNVVADFALKVLGNNPSPLMITTILFLAVGVLTQLISNTAVSYTHLDVYKRQPIQQRSCCLCPLRFRLRRRSA